MDRELDKLYLRLENQREKLLAVVRELSEEQHNFSRNGKWSITEILSHLVTSERLSMDYIRKKSNAIEHVGDTGIIEDLKMLALKISQRLPLKYKAPSHVRQNTPVASLQEIERKWEHVRTDLRDYIDKLDPTHSKRKIYKHPVAGRLNIKQAMSFFSEHITHHLPQIRRLMS